MTSKGGPNHQHCGRYFKLMAPAEPNLKPNDGPDLMFLGVPASFFDAKQFLGADVGLAPQSSIKWRRQTAVTKRAKPEQRSDIRTGNSRAAHW